MPYIFFKNDNLTRNKPILNKNSPEGFLLAYNQSAKINLIGCDTIVNSPSSLDIIGMFGD